MAEWLAQQTPRVVEDALASRLPQHGVLLEWAAEYHPEHGGYRSLAWIGGEEGANLVAAIDAVKATMTPASKETIIGWLAELSVRCIRREHDEFSDALLLEVYASELMRYPADCAKRGIFSGWKYWPTLDAELIPAVKRYSGARSAVLVKLERAAHG